MRKILSVAVVAALVAAITPTVPATAAPPGLTWGACPPSQGFPPDQRDPRQQCAALRVPLDYRGPHGRQITVEISRIPAANPGLRHGILLLNPGGPGGAGLDMPTWYGRLLPAEVRDRYDLIGFDPRGVAASTPVTCGIDPNTAFDLILPYPAADGSIDRNVTYGRQTAAGCAAHSGGLQPYITTANTARDMDRIRAALGERKLSYDGVSYGTYLGAVYTSLFPQNSDRILLDSAVDPNRVWTDVWGSWGSAIALRLPDFTTWAAARDATYHLGATAEAVTRTYYDVAARLDKAPVTLPDGLVVNGNIFREYTRSSLYGDPQFVPLAEGWQFLAGGSGPPPAVAGRLKPHRAAAAEPVDNQTAALYSVVCNDVAWPRDVDPYAARVAVDRKLYPATAGMPTNIWPCAFWKYRPVEPPVKVTDRGPRNVLILQNLRDPATSWENGYGLRRALGQRASFVSIDQGGHGVYQFTDTPCANAIATAFLVGGTLPARDQLCAGQTPGGVGASTVRPVLPGPLG